MYIFIDNAQLYVYKYTHYIYLHAHIAIDISIKVNSIIIHIFHMNIHSLITFFHRRFVYINTFFHRQIMCDCRLITCLYDIRQTSYEHRLHHSHVAPARADMNRVYISPRTLILYTNLAANRRLRIEAAGRFCVNVHSYAPQRSRAALYIIYIWGKIENHLNYTYANARDFYTLYR